MSLFSMSCICTTIQEKNTMFIDIRTRKLRKTLLSCECDVISLCYFYLFIYKSLFYFYQFISPFLSLCMCTWVSACLFGSEWWRDWTHAHTHTHTRAHPSRTRNCTWRHREDVYSRDHTWCQLNSKRLWHLTWLLNLHSIRRENRMRGFLPAAINVSSLSALF